MESKFTGTVLELILVNLFAGFVTFISFGLLAPWAICYQYRYMADNTIIDGNQLRFDGTATELWGQWLKWLFFIIITLGIYSFWVGLRLEQWRVSRTHMVEKNNPLCLIKHKGFIFILLFVQSVRLSR